MDNEKAIATLEPASAPDWCSNARAARSFQTWRLSLHLSFSCQRFFDWMGTTTCESATCYDNVVQTPRLVGHILQHLAG